MLPPSTPKSSRKAKRRGRTHDVNKSEDVDTPIRSKDEREDARETLGISTAAEHQEDVTTADGKTLIFDPTTDAVDGESKGRGSSGNPPSRISAASEVEVTQKVRDDPGLREGIRETTPDVSVSFQNDVTSNAAVLVKAVRSDENPRNARIAKLRALDYGWIKPKNAKSAFIS